MQFSSGFGNLGLFKGAEENIPMDITPDTPDILDTPGMENPEVEEYGEKEFFSKDQGEMKRLHQKERRQLQDGLENIVGAGNANVNHSQIPLDAITEMAKDRGFNLMWGSDAEQDPAFHGDIPPGLMGNKESGEFKAYIERINNEVQVEASLVLQWDLMGANQYRVFGYFS